MQFDPSRRLFLRRAGIAAVAPIVAPVLPVEKVVKYFFAPAGGWEAPQWSGNEFLDVNWLTAKTLEILRKNLVFAEAFNNTWDQQFKSPLAADGRIQVRIPQVSGNRIGHRPLVHSAPCPA